MQNRQSSAAAVKKDNNNEYSVPVKDAQSGRYVFSSYEFSGIMQKYQNFTFEYRIKNAFLQHSQHDGSKYIFYLIWDDSEKHFQPLKVTVTCDDVMSPKYSRFLAPSNYYDFYKEQFNVKLDPQQKIYSLQVDLITNRGTQFYDERLLLMWFTLEGKIGELSHVESGTGFSGTEVLRVYEYFAQFLRVSHMMICDNSKLVVPQRNVTIPLRLITAVAEEKTWFEKHVSGIRLLDGSIPVDHLSMVNQKSAARKKCLIELQAMQLSEWKKMLDLEQSRKLQTLFDQYFQSEENAKQSFPKLFSRKKENEKRCSLETVTLQMLASAVYRESKESGAVTDNLIILNELLCGNLDVEFGNIPISKKSPDFWVKSRVQQLLWGSYVWKQMTEMDESQSRNDLVMTGSLKL